MKTILKSILSILVALLMAAPGFAIDHAYYVEGTGARERLTIHNDGKSTFIKAVRGLVVSGATADAGVYIIHGIPSRIPARMHGQDITIVRGTPEPAYRYVSASSGGTVSGFAGSGCAQDPTQNKTVSAAELRQRTDSLIADIERLLAQAALVKQDAGPLAITPESAPSASAAIATDKGASLAVSPAPVQEGAPAKPAQPALQSIRPEQGLIIRTNEKVFDVFSNWCKRAGVQLFMDETEDVFLSDAEIRGSFVEVTYLAIDAANNSGADLQAVFNSDNSVLTITSR